jgi:deazaflavin-dependent oxidoreductase (nitroreductase family)
MVKAKPGPVRELLNRAPIPLYRAHLGWVLGSHLLMLTTTGRKTGRIRRTVVEVVKRLDSPNHGDTPTLWVIASRGRHSDWYANAISGGLTRITWMARSFTPRVHALDADERFDPARRLPAPPSACRRHARRGRPRQEVHRRSRRAPTARRRPARTSARARRERRHALTWRTPASARCATCARVRRRAVYGSTVARRSRWIHRIAPTPRRRNSGSRANPARVKRRWAPSPCDPSTRP